MCLVQSGVVCLVDVLEAVDLVSIVSSVRYVVESPSCSLVFVLD